MKARLTIGGAPVFILPGGGINFMVDVEKVMQGAFTWVNSRHGMSHRIHDDPGGLPGNGGS